MLGLLKPERMPIQGSMWSCVRLLQDQKQEELHCGDSSMEEWMVSTSVSPEVYIGPCLEQMEENWGAFLSNKTTSSITSSDKKA